MSERRPPHYLVINRIDRYSTVFNRLLDGSLHRNLELFTVLTAQAAMIQLKPGIHPASLNKPRKPSDRRKNRPTKKKETGLHFERVCSDAALAPFDQVEWEGRTAEINDDSGKVIFKQENVEVPKSWSALATKIAVSKYFYGDIANGTDPSKSGRETSVRQLVHRVTRTIAD